MPMRDCLRELAAWREVFADEPDLDAEGWRGSWFPLLRASSGSAVVAVIGEQSECQTGYFHAEFGFRAASASITALVERWGERIERREWTWDPRMLWTSNPPGLITEVL
jgi:hypothetical protein